jgi:hypothetical protein
LAWLSLALAVAIAAQLAGDSIGACAIPGRDFPVHHDVAIAGRLFNPALFVAWKVIGYFRRRRMRFFEIIDDDIRWTPVRDFWNSRPPCRRSRQRRDERVVHACRL